MVTPRSPSNGTNLSMAIVAEMRSRKSSGNRPGSRSSSEPRGDGLPGDACSTQLSLRSSAFQPPRSISCQPMCVQPASPPYDKAVGLAMQYPVEVLAHARIRTDRSGCAASEDLQDS